MYPSYSKLIRGHRDLPLRINQWGNAVRWEFRHPTPFIRSRKFLWEEGHTAFATKEEADQEAFIPNTGCGIQGATSHCLGQNFTKMFEINFENEEGEKRMVWQKSWAYSTRTIGLMIMVHGDDKGLVLPPKVAPIQVVVIPVTYKDADTQGILDACAATVKTLNESGFRSKADLRDNYSPGWKYSDWEMKGVPLRIEIGPRDLANKQVRAIRRDSSVKINIPTDNLVEQVRNLLDTIQQSLVDVAKQKKEACTQVVKTLEEFVEALGQKKLILAPWCDEEEVEKDLKDWIKQFQMGAFKSLCSPLLQPELPEGTLCFFSGKPKIVLSLSQR